MKNTNFWIVLIGLTGSLISIFVYVTGWTNLTTTLSKLPFPNGPSQLQEAYVPIPAGYSVLQFTVSPNGHYGVTAPDADHYIQSAFQHQIVDLLTGRAIGLIRADTGLVDPKVRMNRGGINPARWSEYGNVLLWEVEGRWSPRALVLVKIADNGNEIQWQLDLLKTVQKETLIRTKAVAPEAYAKAKEINKGSGSAFPDGFVVNVRANIPADSTVTFPLPIHAGLTSNPKGDPLSRGENELNSELDGTVDFEGKFTVKYFGLSNKRGSEIAVPNPPPPIEPRPK